MLLKRGKAGIIALSGILLALAVIFTILANVLPAGKLALYSIASFTVSVIIIEVGVAYAWLYYAASCALLIFLAPDKTSLLPHIAFFGFYGIIKYYIERGNGKKRLNIVVEYLLKLAVFNICFGISAIIALKVLGIGYDEILRTRLPWQIVVLLAQAVFLVYDYAYNIFISYYTNYLRGRLGRNNG